MASAIYLRGGGMTTPNAQIFLHSSAAVSEGLPHFEILGSSSEYVMQVRTDDNLITETYPLFAVATAATLRRWERAMTDMLKRGIKFHTDRFTPHSVWLVHDFDTEGLKYALVHGFALNVLTEGLANPGFTHGLGRWQLAITRSPFFERPTTDSSDLIIEAEEEDVSASGGKWYTAPDFDYKGDLDGRISEIAFTYNVNQLATIYAGFRPVRDETFTYGNYNGWVQCEGGTEGADTSAVTDTEETASGGQAMMTDFATAATKTMIGRFALAGSDFAADRDIYVGTYKVLLRARLDTPGSEVGLEMQVRYGANANGPSLTTSHTYFKYNTAHYTLVEMGEMTLPPHPFRDSAAALSMGNFYLVFRAEKVTLEPKLYCDAIALIPAEHYVKLEIADPTNAPSTSSLRLYTDEDDKMWAAVVDDDLEILQGVTPDPKNWFYPARQGVLVVAALEGTDRVHSLNRTMDIAMTIHPRFQAHWEDDPE